MSSIFAHLPTVVLQAGAPFAAGVSGGVLGVLGGRGGESRASQLPLVSFAAGAFVVAALTGILPEAAESVGWVPSAIAVIVGVGLTALLAQWAGTACPACDDGAHKHPGVILQLSTPLLVVLTIHSTLDGLGLTTPGAPGAPGGSDSGNLLSIALFGHKLPEGLAIAALCLSSGTSPARALAIVTAIEGCTFLGLAAGTMLPWPPYLLGGSLALVAGSFLFVAGIALASRADSDNRLRELAAAAIGAALILIVRFT